MIDFPSSFIFLFIQFSIEYELGGDELGVNLVNEYE